MGLGGGDGAGLFRCHGDRASHILGIVPTWIVRGPLTAWLIRGPLDRGGQAKRRQGGWKRPSQPGVAPGAGRGVQDRASKGGQRLWKATAWGGGLRGTRMGREN